MGYIEAAPPNYIPVYIPPHPLGRLDAARVPLTWRDLSIAFIFSLLSQSGVPSAVGANS